MLLTKLRITHFFQANRDNIFPDGASIDEVVAALTTRCPNDQEHVTPFIKRKYGVDYFEAYKFLNKHITVAQ